MGGGEERGPGGRSAGLQPERPLRARCVERSRGPGRGGLRAETRPPRAPRDCCGLAGGGGRSRRSAGMAGGARPAAGEGGGEAGPRAISTLPRAVPRQGGPSLAERVAPALSAVYFCQNGLPALVGWAPVLRLEDVFLLDVSGEHSTPASFHFILLSYPLFQ